MKPNETLITITDNLTKIKQLLLELVLEPRVNAIKWSRITKQTPNIKIGYPGQHLASLITGMEGERTGARGNDLVDGSEVKSCSRIDQLDKCEDCEAGVSRIETNCSECGSANIKRNNDSKWLFGVRSKEELDVLLHEVKRIVLLLADYPNFDEEDFETLRFQAFEIWPESPRNNKFAEIITNYYYKIYLEHKKEAPTKTPAPKNFWPYQYQFYVCNPILTFSCLIYNSNTKPEIKIEQYIEPHVDRSIVPAIIMPTEVLKKEELELIVKSVKKIPLEGINEKLRSILPLRDTDRISFAKSQYKRKSRS